MYQAHKHASAAAADLARRPDLRVGSTSIAPATRALQGPGGQVVVQPRVMLLLLALVDAKGAVLTRDDLAQRCWAGRFVADDTLNNAVAELRKALRAVSGDEVAVETVPKTGYRLRAPDLSPLDGPTPTASSDRPFLSRRTLVAAGLASGLTLSAGLWWRSAGPASEANLLVERAAIALRQGLPESGSDAARSLREATSLEPGNAKAWGMLAIALRAVAEYAGPAEAGTARTDAELAARRALALDPRQSDALAALATLVPAFGHWIDAERRIRQVLAVDPANEYAVGALGTLLMSTGQVRACLQRLDWLNERIPLAPNLQFRRVYTLWSVGRLAEMDQTADQAMQVWPRHPAVWFSRLWTLAFTDRIRAAQALFDDPATRPSLPPPALRVLQLSLLALRTRQERDVKAAISANFAAAAIGPGQSTTAIMILSALGVAQRALEAAEGYLARRGPLVVRLRHTPAQPSVTDQHQRMAMMLWIPVTEPLRLQPGFQRLCDDIGLVRYWRSAGRRPDFDRVDLVARRPQPTA